MVVQRAPGLLVLFGSGETSPTGGQIYEALGSRLRSPLRGVVLETPAGFQPNSADVAGKVADFLCLHLRANRPEMVVVPARKRNTSFSPDDALLTRPILDADLIFLGPGSPTYAVRQLESTIAWQRVVARHRLGASVILASAAVMAFSCLTLPVYEIFKVGADVHWQPGLDFLAPFGLSVVFVSHWNNREGGASLDTSCCYMGQERFAQLRALLTADRTIVGIDEQTALVVDFAARACRVLGKGSVVVIRGDRQSRFRRGQDFDPAEMGPFRTPADPTGLPPPVWEEALAAQQNGEQAPDPALPAEVQVLVAQRQAAREHRDWAMADDLRQRIASLGWKVSDTPEGPLVEPAAARTEKSHEESIARSRCS